MSSLAASFWRFSLRAFRDPLIRAACLGLQDENGADVNLLLYCCWQGRRGRRLGAAELRSAMSAVANWQLEVVRPLRAARRALRARGAKALPPRHALLRKRAGALELAAERIENERLAVHAEGLRALAARVEPRGAARDNLRGYLERIGVDVERDAAARVATLVSSCGAGPARR